MQQSGWPPESVPRRSSTRSPGLPEWPAWLQQVLLASAQRISARPVFSLLASSPQPVWLLAWQPVWRQRFSRLAWQQVLLRFWPLV
jgi:hypothetical protein